MQFKILNRELSAKASGGTETQSAIKIPILSVSRNWLIWTALLSIFAVTKSWANVLPDFSALVENEGSAVVKISVVTSRSSAANNPGFDLDQLPDQLKRFFEQMPDQQPAPRQGRGFGSGFIISDDGYIITNAHVVDSASEILVGLQDRSEYKAKLIGTDKTTDIALLKVDANNLPVVRQGNSDNVKVGQWVLAIGSPFGFEYSATQGIVSAVARNLPSDTYVPFIQTDVAVNPGNSGGPLFNTNGEVIGVNSQIYSRSGGYQGLSFAIPINVARNIADQLREKGYASRGWLGVTIQDVDQDLAESFGLNRPTGALIADVTENSPAAKSGLRSGDIIIEFNDSKVSHSGKLPPMVGAVNVGTSVSVLLLRDGAEQTVDVVIEELEADRQSIQVGESDSDDKLGLVVGDLTENQRAELSVDSGVLIEEVVGGTPAADAGLQAGDVIVSLDRKPVNSVEEFIEQVETLPTGKSFPILVQRGESSLFRAIKIPQSNE